MIVHIIAIATCIIISSAYAYPAFGLLSDQVGRKSLLIAFGILGTLSTVPILTALSHVHSDIAAFILIMTGLVIVSGYTSINAVVKAELFPGEVRALSVGLPHALTTAIFGATAEYAAYGLKRQVMKIIFTGTLVSAFLFHCLYMV